MTNEERIKDLEARLSEIAALLDGEFEREPHRMAARLEVGPQVNREQ